MKTLKQIALLMVLSVMLSGCSPGSQGADQAQSPENEALTLSIAYGASVGTTWHVVCEGVAEILRETYPGSNINVIPGNSDSNLVRLQKGEIELGISATDSANSAAKGIEAFDEPFSPGDVYGLVAVYDAKVQLFAMKNLVISTIEEIREKQLPVRISVHTTGSSVELTARRVLAEYGITYDDIESWGGRVVYVAASDAAQMMGDGQLDAFFGLSAVPMSHFTELELKRDFVLLPISEPVMEIVHREYNYAPAVIPAGTYKGQTDDITTISVVNGLYISGTTDEETAYRITTALLDNLGKLQMIHSQMGGLTPEFMNNNMIFPIHPGAQRAYEAFGN